MDPQSDTTPKVSSTEESPTNANDAKTKLAEQKDNAPEDASIKIYSSIEEFDSNLPPTVTLLRNEFGSKIYIVGTAHFSKESQDDVSLVIRDVVMVELCAARVQIFTMNNYLGRMENGMLIFVIIGFSFISVSAQDYFPPVIDETHQNIDSKDVKCLATLSEMLEVIGKVDPKKTVEIGGYHIDATNTNRRKTVQLSKSETFLTDLMENICEKLDDYAKARFKSNGTITLLKLTTPGGGMNPAMSSVDFIQDGDLNKSLKHFCLEVLEDNDEAILSLLMQDKIPDDSEVQLCSLAANYCDDLPIENDYVLEDHEEL